MQSVSFGSFVCGSLPGPLVVSIIVARPKRLCNLFCIICARTFERVDLSQFQLKYNLPLTPDDQPQPELCALVPTLSGM